MRPESAMQLKVCEYLQDHYKDVLFHSDLSAGMALAPWQSAMNKRFQFSNGLPDLYILEARHGYHGLMLELKVEGFKVYLKDGVTLVASERIRSQAVILSHLLSKGYLAAFACGYDEAIFIINTYLSDHA